MMEVLRRAAALLPYEGAFPLSKLNDIKARNVIIQPRWSPNPERKELEGQ